MACDTFIKIAMKCRRYFVQVQVGEAMPFIEEILNSMATIISDLQPQQVIKYYKLLLIRLNLMNFYNLISRYIPSMKLLVL